ncbi:MAG: dihydroxyacetone kinase subunit L [Spirochaetaceae bacterium]|jgi:dihydroxyacetone kinase-like protein|nr:dihydroxyacetone kinase subunit L [Spirochaetaceae bacterium]
MMITLQQLIDWLKKLDVVYTEQKDFLSKLDSDIGDGDHGVNMARGFSAVSAAIDSASPSDIGAVFKTVSMSLIKNVGGASGPLYGTFFLRAAADFAGKQEVDLSAWTRALEKGVAGIEQLGKAQKGDKTMLDAWLPALAALKEAEGNGIKEALKSAVDAAEEGMKNTIPLQAKKGRASYLGERSIGHQDPGATSTFLLLQSAAEILG